MKNYERIAGSLVGGAAGDALGYEIEFCQEDEIRERFGESGIREFVLNRGVAEISDDTQMTLFTAAGLLMAEDPQKEEDFLQSVWQSYQDWLKTQRMMRVSKAEMERNRLLRVRELFDTRAPGGTCLAALSRETMGTLERPVNDRKGCGGVMRVAPIGLFYTEDMLPLEEICRRGAMAAAMTHGHPLGYIPAAGLVHMVCRLSQHTRLTVRESVDSMMAMMPEIFPEDESMEIFLNKMRSAVKLADGELSDQEAIHCLGEGWVAEETLAIAVFCALRYEKNMEKALIASVNHRGDSDSTGSVTGNILGARLGLRGIPAKFRRKLELVKLIEQYSERLTEI